MTVYVLWWKYFDGSGVGIERVYTDMLKANSDLNLIRAHSDSKDWNVTELQVTE